MSSEISPVAVDMTPPEQKEVRRYRLPAESEESVLGLDVREGAYTAEWHTQKDLQWFRDTVSESVSGAAYRDASASFEPTGEDYAGLDTTFRNITDQEDYPDDCTYLQLKAGPYKIAWENWESYNILILTSDSTDPEPLQDYVQASMADEMPDETINEILTEASSILHEPE